MEKTIKATNSLLGIKLGSAQIFDKKGKAIPVTIIKAGPCFILQVKNIDRDGYNAYQIGFLPKRKVNKPLKGHIQKRTNKKTGFKYIKEFRVNKPVSVKENSQIKVDIFKENDRVKITGISKAKGFQGTVKRHDFKGASRTHGTKHAHRQPGSIGSTDAARVFKGKKMPGRMGAKTTTIKNLKVVGIQEKDNLLIIKGAVPGNINGLLKITKTS